MEPRRIKAKICFQSFFYSKFILFFIFATWYKFMYLPISVKCVLIVSCPDHELSHLIFDGMWHVKHPTLHPWSISLQTLCFNANNWRVPPIRLLWLLYWTMVRRTRLSGPFAQTSQEYFHQGQSCSKHIDDSLPLSAVFFGSQLILTFSIAPIRCAMMSGQRQIKLILTTSIVSTAPSLLLSLKKLKLNRNNTISLFLHTKCFQSNP